MSKEFCVCAFNKKSGMSGFYSVPKKLLKVIKKGTIFYAKQNNGDAFEVQAMG